MGSLFSLPVSVIFYLGISLYVFLTCYTSLFVHQKSEFRIWYLEKKKSSAITLKPESNHTTTKDKAKRKERETTSNKTQTNAQLQQCNVQFWLQALSLPLSKKNREKPGVVVAFNLSTREAEAGQSLRVQGQPALHREFQDSRDTYYKTKQKTKTKKETTPTKRQRRKTWRIRNICIKLIQGERK